MAARLPVGRGDLGRRAVRTAPQAPRMGCWSGSDGVFEQVPVPDHPGGGSCPPGDGPERGGVALGGCHVGFDGFGRAVADGVLDHLGDEGAAIGGSQLIAVQEVAQLGGAGAGGLGRFWRSATSSSWSCAFSQAVAATSSSRSVGPGGRPVDEGDREAAAGDDVPGSGVAVASPTTLDFKRLRFALLQS